MIERARRDGGLQLDEVKSDFIAQTQAAGLRHRRDGLAYRLTWRRSGLAPRKRIAPSPALPLRRKLVYRLRFAVARWSHRMFRLAQRFRMPIVYMLWARTVLRLYQSVTWSRGRLGKFLDALLPQPEH